MCSGIVVYERQATHALDRFSPPGFVTLDAPKSLCHYDRGSLVGGSGG